MKIAIIGCGAISKVHAEALSKIKDVEICAFCDIIPERAEELRGIYNLDASVYTDYREMLEKERPFSVHVCTPHYLHSEMAIFALNLNIEVMLEKPACINEEQLEALKKAASSSTARLCVSFQNRFLKASRYAKNIIDSGSAGKILGTRGIVTWHRDADYYRESGWRGFYKTEGGGVMINQAIHTLDLMQWICGMPEEVEATTSNRHLKGVIEVEDTAEAFFKFGGGFNGLFYATTAYCKNPKIMLEIVCENKTLRLMGNQLFVDDALYVSPDEAAPRSGKSYWGAGHQTLFEEFYSVKDKTPVSVDEAAKALKILWAVYRSNNKPVSLK